MQDSSWFAENENEKDENHSWKNEKGITHAHLGRPHGAA
jgi:hypothetical protein